MELSKVLCPSSSFFRELIKLDYREVLIVSANDVDGLCCVQMLQDFLASRLSLQTRLLVVSCYSELRRAMRLNSAATSMASGAAIFINLGVRQDLRSLLAEVTPSLCFVLDYNRPINWGYFTEQSSIVVKLVCSAEEQAFMERTACAELDGHASENTELVANGIMACINYTRGGEYPAIPSVCVLLEALSTVQPDSLPPIWLDCDHRQTKLTQVHCSGFGIPSLKRLDSA